jgi:hypothetical protein
LSIKEKVFDDDRSESIDTGRCCTVTIQDSREYTQENSPEYFPVLVLEQGEDGALILQSLARD